MANILKHLDSLGYVTQVECVVELSHDIGAHFRDLQHLTQLFEVTGDEVQE